MRGRRKVSAAPVYDFFTYFGSSVNEFLIAMMKWSVTKTENLVMMTAGKILYKLDPVNRVSAFQNHQRFSDVIAERSKRASELASEKNSVIVFWLQRRDDHGCRSIRRPPN